jgi:hypothetical protein
MSKSLKYLRTTFKPKENIMSKFKHYSPKEVALAKWNNEQRPKYMEKIEREAKRTFMLRRVEDMEARAEIRVTMTRKS